jgi:hypothetical protein
MGLADGRRRPAAVRVRPVPPVRIGAAPRRGRRRGRRCDCPRAGGRSRGVRRNGPVERADGDDRDRRRMVGHARPPRFHRRDEGRDGRRGRRRRDDRSERRTGGERAARPPRRAPVRGATGLRRPGRSPAAARRRATRLSGTTGCSAGARRRRSARRRFVCRRAASGRRSGSGGADGADVARDGCDGRARGTRCHARTRGGRDARGARIAPDRGVAARIRARVGDGGRRRVPCGRPCGGGRGGRAGSGRDRACRR